MSSENLVKILENNKGPYAALVVLISCTVAVLKLPPDQIGRIQQAWPVLIFPAFFVFLGYAFNAYIIEQKTRTQVESGIYSELTQIGERIEKILEKILDDKAYYNAKFIVLKEPLDLKLKSKILLLMNIVADFICTE